MRRNDKALEKVVANLTNPSLWTWTRVITYRDAADTMLALLAREGLIERRIHPYGGYTWRINGKLFGRTDGITHEKFDAMKP